jgi:hypothetical protein
MAVITLNRNGKKVEVETYLTRNKELEVHVFLSVTDSRNRTYKDEWFFDKVPFNVKIENGEINFKESWIDLRDSKIDSHIPKTEIDILMDYMEITNVQKGAIEDYSSRYKGVEL